MVLLPEVPPDSSETNALMRLDTLPPFSEITPIDCVNGLAKLSIEFETEMTLHAERLDQLPKTFESVRTEGDGWGRTDGGGRSRADRRTEKDT